MNNYIVKIDGEHNVVFIGTVKQGSDLLVKIKEFNKENDTTILKYFNNAQGFDIPSDAPVDESIRNIFRYFYTLYELEADVRSSLYKGYKLG